MQTTYEFRQIYCAQNAITEGEYIEHLLNKALPAHARAFRSLLSLAFQNQNHFRSDFDFINDVGRLRSYRDYRQSVDQFVHHPWNRRTVLRWILRLRVSTTRVRRIVREQLKTQTKPESQMTVTTEVKRVHLAPPEKTISAISTEGILSDQQKADIKSRLEQITAAQTSGQTKRSISTNGQVAVMESGDRYERTFTAQPSQEPDSAALAEELKVLRVINERLKIDLAKVTAQRDILKQAAAILACP